MDIREAQKKIKENLGEIEHPRLASFIALTEEVGEVANEIMKKEIYEEKDASVDKIKEEIADVFICILELANVYKFDLSEEFEKKLSNIEPRAEKWKKELSEILQNKRNKLN